MCRIAKLQVAVQYDQMNQMSEPEIRRGRKFEQVLAGARRVFLRDGFEGGSVDDIAREAGVSKATLYAYFPDKRLLFKEIFAEEIRRRTTQAKAEIDPASPAAARLLHAARKISDFLVSDYGRGMFRLMLAESGRFPDLARQFYRMGPMELHRHLVELLRDLAARGDVAIADFDLAADQFSQLCRAHIHDRLVFGMTEEIRPDLAETALQGAVDMFLSHYGCQPQG